MKKYLITTPSFYTNESTSFVKILKNQWSKHQPDYILFRDKVSGNYDEMAVHFIQTCASLKNVKSFLHQNVTLAKSLGATGVHLTSLQFNEIQQAKSLGLEVIVSTHTHKEVLEAEALGADCVTYSPIFFSPDKGEPKGVEDLKKVVQDSTLNIFALGGIIDEKQLELIGKVKPYGFASIRYFY